MSAEDKKVEKSDSSSSFEDLAGDSDLAESKSPAAQPKQSTSSTEPAESDDWLDILGSKSILKKVIVKGDEEITEDGEEARKPQRFDLCTISYSTRLDDAKQTLVEKHDNINVYLGDWEVIQGLDLAITLMYRGENSLLKMSPRFAYGDLGLKKSQVEGSAPGLTDVDEKKLSEGPPSDDEYVVGPDDWLLINVTLHDWMEEPDNDSLSLKERLKLGRRRRIRGNWWYGRGDDAAAIKLYRRALDALHESTGGIEYEPDKEQLTGEAESDVQRLIEERCRANNNLAAAHLRAGSLSAAAQAVDAVLACQPDNPKALYRKAKVLLLSGEGGAAAAAARAAAAAGAGGAAQRLGARASARERRDARDERQRAKRMIQGVIGEEATDDADKPKPRSKFLVWGGLLLSFLVGVAGMLFYRYRLQD